MPLRPRRLLTAPRQITAVLGLAVMNLAPFGVRARGVCTPGMNCHGCPSATSTCPVGAMAYGSALHTVPAAVFGGVLAVGLLSGRLICGFICPFGWFQDLLYRLPGPKGRLPEWTRAIKYVMLAGFVLLLPWLLGLGVPGFVSLDPPALGAAADGLQVTVTVRNPSPQPVHGLTLYATYGEEETGLVFPQEFPEIVIEPGETRELPGFVIADHLDDHDLSVTSPQTAIKVQPPRLGYFCSFCPVGTYEAFIPAVAGAAVDGAAYQAGGGGLGAALGANWFRISLGVAMLIGMWMVSRCFCRVLCPLGAAYALTTPLAMSRITIDTDRCTSCGICSRACPVDLDVLRQVGGPECIACGDCIPACPQSGIRRRFGW